VFYIESDSKPLSSKPF